jgi:hypothetical protein
MSMEMSAKTFHRHFYFSTFLSENKNVCKIPIDICEKEFGKIQMSVEMSMKTFHRRFYFPTFFPENTNIYRNANGNFP